MTSARDPRSPLPPKDVRLLRAVLARELETINEYEQMAEQAEDPHIRAFFLHLAKEEKEHVAEAMALINERDPEQKQELDEADTRIEHFNGQLGGASKASAPNITTGPTGGPMGFTVGSLRKRAFD